MNDIEDFENMMRGNMLKTRMFKIPDDIKEPQHRILWWNEQCCILSAKEAAESLETKLAVAVEALEYYANRQYFDDTLAKLALEKIKAK